MFSLFSGNKKSTMAWQALTATETLDAAIEESKSQPVLLFKHSTTCAISAMALNRLEAAFEEDKGIIPYYLDLLSYRDISNEISTRFGITHQSPQALLLKDGEVVYHASHNSISFKEMLDKV